MAELAPRRRRRSSYALSPHWVTTRRVIAGLLLAVVAVGGIYGYGILSSISRLTGQNLVRSAKDLFATTLHQVGHSLPDTIPRTTIAVYGYGGGTHDGAYLSDSILLVTIQKQSGQRVQVAETSVPRDWYVNLDLGGGQKTWGRINEAYSDGISGTPAKASGYSAPLGGGQLANANLEHLLGIHIDHFIGIDFHAFQAAVDSVGGVDVDVERSFTDPQYPSDGCDGGGDGKCYETTVSFKAGRQHMDGHTALIFARSRHSTDMAEGTDFARSKRQQLVVAALKKKAGGFGLVTDGPKILSSLSNDITTDISDLGQFSDLYNSLKTVDSSTIEHISIDDSNFLYECGYPDNCSAAYLFTHDTTHATIQHYMQNVIPDPGVIDEKAPITVEDASNYGNGASTRWASLLGELGLKATDGGAVRRQGTTRVIDGSGGRGARTAAWLAQYYGVQVEQPDAAPTAATRNGTQPQASPATGGVAVILGSDEEHSFNDQSGDSEGGSSTGYGGSSNSGSYSYGRSKSYSGGYCSYNCYATPVPRR